MTARIVSIDGGPVPLAPAQRCEEAVTEIAEWADMIEAGQVVSFVIVGLAANGNIIRGIGGDRVTPAMVGGLEMLKVEMVQAMVAQDD